MSLAIYMVTGTSVGVWSVIVLTCSYGCVLFVYITDVGGFIGEVWLHK